MTARPSTGTVIFADLIAIPPSHSAAYKIAAAIYEKGDMPESELFHHASYDKRPSNRRRLINDCLESKWFVQCGEKISIGPAVIEHFERLAKKDQPEPVDIGRIAGIRDLGSVYARPPLSKRNIPSSRGFRDDVPEYSVRVGQSFRTVA